MGWLVGSTHALGCVSSFRDARNAVLVTQLCGEADAADGTQLLVLLWLIARVIYVSCWLRDAVGVVTAVAVAFLHSMTFGTSGE